MQDPIGYVLDALWAHSTAIGQNPASLLEALVAERNFGDAMMLAVAIEIDRAKRDESRQFWRQPDVEKLGILDELGKRTLFDFMSRHINDWRELRKGPTPPPPPMTG